MMGESCRMAAVAFDLQAPHCTVMRSNSVLTPLHLCPLPPLFPFPSFLSCSGFTFACGNPPIPTPLLLWFVTI